MKRIKTFYQNMLREIIGAYYEITGVMIAYGNDTYVTAAISRLLRKIHCHVSRLRLRWEPWKWKSMLFYSDEPEDAKE